VYLCVLHGVCRLNHRTQPIPPFSRTPTRKQATHSIRQTLPFPPHMHTRNGTHTHRHTQKRLSYAHTHAQANCSINPSHPSPRTHSQLHTHKQKRKKVKQPRQELTGAIKVIDRAMK
jgi:hypothetical protein